MVLGTIILQLQQNTDIQSFHLTLKIIKHYYDLADVLRFRSTCKTVPIMKLLSTAVMEQLQTRKSSIEAGIRRYAISYTICNEI